MAKSTGLGMRCFVDNTDVSGNIGVIKTISGGPAALDFTDITQSGKAVLGGYRTGHIDVTTYFDPLVAHPELSGLVRTDLLTSVATAATLGAPAASCMAKQIGYDGTRPKDGSLALDVSALANGYGLEWGKALTPGVKTDVAAGFGTSIDDAASTAFGLQAYIHVLTFVGTDVTLKIQDSADNVTFADLTGGSFGVFTTAAGGVRIATANNATVRRYVRMASTTSGGFTSVSYFVMYNRNLIAAQVF